MGIVAYVDESADSKRERVFALAGFAAHEQFWEEFQARMGERLREDGIDVFHMTDCESCWGEFRKWQDDKAKSIALVSDLISLILDSQLVGIWSGVHMETYNRVVKGRVLPLIDHPYFFCFVHCFGQMLRGMRDLPPEEKLSFVFEENAEVKRFVLGGHRGLRDFPFLPEDERLRIGDAAFAPKKSSRALQAADLLAYECFKYLDNLWFNPQIPERKSLARLKKRIVYSSPLEEPVLARIVLEVQAFETALKSALPELDVLR
jgi:hypothetical protein